MSAPPSSGLSDASAADAPFTLAFTGAIRDIGREVWQGLHTGGQPFLSYDFLEALEATGTVGENTGWVPHHAVLRERAEGTVLAVMPAYLKFHSWGEFVFDWAWADAYRRYGLNYYPKLLCAVPYTPVTGTRVLLSNQLIAGKTSSEIEELAPPPAAARAALETGATRDGDVPPGAGGASAAATPPGAAARGLAPADRVRAALLGTLADAVQEEMDVSSFHLLFPREAERDAMARCGYLLRKDCQFQWHNRGYASFADFLAVFASAKRKKVKRERRRVEEEGIRFEWLAGDAIDADTWRLIYRFYASTFLKRGHEPYFPQALFPLLGERLGDRLLVCLARHGAAGRPVAAAVFFRDDTTLYGRYWGCEANFHSLHFETCYYQGIDYCIREGLQRFEPGTQGEHKLTRGFEPTATWSGHVIGEPAFAQAIESYVRRERDGVDAYMGSASEHLPFRRGGGGTGDGP